MQEYKDYQNELKRTEAEEKRSNGSIEYFAPAVFLLVFCAISAGATFYLNHAGMKSSPLYEKLIGAENAAYLVLFILEGSFIALSLFGHHLLKSEEQRKAGKLGLLALKVVLSLNILVAFLHLTGITSAPLLEKYSQWGAPITVIGAGVLWSYIVAHRRKTKMRNQFLDDSAKITTLWGEQHRRDQERYRTTYETITNSDEMQSLREQIAVRHAIEQIAQQSGLTYSEASTVYHETKDREKATRTYGQAQAYWLPPAQNPPALPPPPSPSSLPSPQAPPPPSQNMMTPAPASPMAFMNPADLTEEELKFLLEQKHGKKLSH